MIFLSFFNLPLGFDSVAQQVEQYTFNVWVLGSNPSGITFLGQFFYFVVLI